MICLNEKGKRRRKVIINKVWINEKGKIKIEEDFKVWMKKNNISKEK